MGVIDQPVNYTFNASQWYHVVASQYFSGSNLSNVTYYVNGQSIGNFTNTTSYNSGINQTKRIGDKGNITNAQNFDGTIDELRIWNRSLSKDEVYQLYISNLRKYDTNKWKLYINQSQNSTNTLSNGAYTYQAFITDTSSNANQTEQRTLYIQDTIENATLQIKTVKDTYTPGEDVDLTDPPPG
jgi:GH15 family glucan-1,4-alpha-glucosidase